MSRIKNSAFVLLQFLLPKHLLTAFIHWLARIRIVPVKNFLIEKFVRLFRVDVDEIDLSIPGDFIDFNAFFTRELGVGRRIIDSERVSIVSPVDGTVSTSGTIRAGSIFQAKGIHYSLDDLLATDIDGARQFHEGLFATIYLAPYNYHRVHLPIAGEIVSATYVPGDLYSVNEATVSRLPNLFTQNERLVCYFETEVGKMVLIMVGALNVGSISTAWSGEIRPQKSGVANRIDLSRSGIDTKVEKGGLLGWFNMGSTVILLLPPGKARWTGQLASGQEVQMGEKIGSLSARDVQ